MGVATVKMGGRHSDVCLLAQMNFAQSHLAEPTLFLYVAGAEGSTTDGQNIPTAPLAYHKRAKTISFDCVSVNFITCTK